MSKRISLVLGGLALASSVASAAAADLVLGTHRIPLSATTQSANMDVQTGELRVLAAAQAGVAGDGWCPPDLAATPAVTHPQVVLQLPNGGNYRIGLADANVEVATNGDVIVHSLHQSGFQGDGWCPLDPSLVTALSADRSIMYPGRNVYLNWTSSGAVSCDTSGSVFPAGVTSVPGWTGSVSTQATGFAVQLDVAGYYQLRVNCEAANGDRFGRAVFVTVLPAPDCSGEHAPPARFTRATSFVNTANLRVSGNQEWPVNATLDLTMWNPPLPGQLTTGGVNRSVLGSFGTFVGDTAVVPISSSGYVAFRIDTGGQANKLGSISSEQPGENSAPMFMTISPCPGDFEPQEMRCRSNYGIAAMGWRTTPSMPESYCPMQPGLDYYLNVAFRNPANGISDCTFGTCWWLLHQNCQTGCN
ncbi:hypothetical protein [Ahniella affigens]|uniref:hypothetical protein n=1 Tax=Ahniella affigens TaxID=2021234 RepID=UPI0011B25EED|nr:hypothetical protein [Ahniella affigens]